MPEGKQTQLGRFVLRHVRALHWVGLAALGLCASNLGTGCSNVILVGSTGSHSSGNGSGPGAGAGSGGDGASGPIEIPKANKIDVVLAIDNSSSMADKQQILAAAVPDLVNRLVNPLCLDASGSAVLTQPSNPTEDCPSGSQREFAPIVDINIGIVDSSLGGDGSDSCPENDPVRNNDDHGHLVARAPQGTTTYENEGFLAWDPDSKRSPPGLTDPAKLENGLTDLVIGAGQTGCGYEHQLESVTRFLVDPNPYAQLDKGSGGIPPITPSGTDTVILQQRADFLRPDSLLAVVMLSDENDCSINVLGPQNYAVLNSAPFYRASSICATNPNDQCCYSCGLGAPAGCTADAACSNPKLSPAQDSVNLKCWNQKKRYGFDALFPVKRYVNAFSQRSIGLDHADLSVVDSSQAVPNPIFTDLGGNGSPVRDPGLVFFVGILGVPYQAVARDPSDLSQGLKSYDELTQTGFFDEYVGDPDNHIEPTSPIMVEDYHQRGVPAGAPNGGDRTIDSSSDLQYACIFDLATPNPTGPECFGGAESNSNPLCTAGGEPQIGAKAYPGLRELAVIHGLGAQGVTSSICPQNSTDPTQANFGYRPAIAALIARITPRLSP